MKLYNRLLSSVLAIVTIVNAGGCSTPQKNSENVVCEFSCETREDEGELSIQKNIQEGV